MIVVSFKAAMFIKRRSIVNLYSCLVCSLDFSLSTDELQSEVLREIFAFLSLILEIFLSAFVAYLFSFTVGLLVRVILAIR